ncbi:MAG TPA: NUDIX domain-containing protein [Planctomycetota bacterium]|nr:NUDIX domain-containing protein [Planctomycetota bacterium]
MKQSAGTLLYRRGKEGLEVLLVHPSGAYNRNAPWSIPKGVPDEGETLEEAARRETFEETGVRAAGTLTPLGHVDYAKSRKRIFAFAAEAPPDAAPRPASWEVDAAEFISLERARRLLHPDQVPFLDRLEACLAGRPERPPQ